MDELVVIALISISALLGTAMRLTRKYVMKHMKNYSIVFIDAIITGIAMITAALYFGGTHQLQIDIKKLHGKTLAAFIGASLCITISTVIGYELLRTQKLSYLILISTGVGIIATMIAASIFLDEKITFNKMLAVPVLLFGVYLASFST